MLGARGREGIKHYRRRNERFLRNEIQYFQKIIQTFQNVETDMNPQLGQPMGRRRMAGDGRGSKAQGPVSKSEAVICPGEQDRVNPGPAPPPTEPVEGREEPRDNSPEAVASQGWARAPYPHPSTRMTASSSQRRDGATARVHRAQGTQNRPFRDREPAPLWTWHPEPEGDWDRRSLLHATTCGNMNGSHRWRCAAQADQEHLTARTGYNSLPLRLSRVGRAGTVKPTNRGAREGPEHIVTKPVTKAKDNPPPLPEGEPLKNRTKSAFRKENTHVGCPEELHRAPTKLWRTRETPPEEWQTGQDPRTTRTYASSVRTWENGRTRHFRTRTLRIEIQSVKGRDGQTPTHRQGDIHAKRKGRCQEQRPYRYARNQKPRPHPQERSEAENLRHPERTPAAHTGKSDFRKSR